MINVVRSVFPIIGQYDVVAHVVVRDTDHLRPRPGSVYEIVYDASQPLLWSSGLSQRLPTLLNGSSAFHRITALRDLLHRAHDERGA
jgi:hypothetical protein